MRTQLLIGALAFSLATTSSTIYAQTTSASPDGSQTTPGQPEDPANPNPMPDPSNPTPPMTDPLPPEMPMPAGEAQAMPPMGNRDAPMGPMATPPSSGADNAVSGGTTTAMMTPTAATKEYPPCSKTIKDACTNPGERVKTGKKRR